MKNLNGFVSAIFLVGLGASATSGCIEKLGSDCKNTKTCPSEGGSSGDGNTGGSATGGHNSGGGDGDSGGSGGGVEPACNPACSSDTVCDEDTMECVGCLEDDHCEGDTSYCELTTHQCVACLGTDQCTDAEASVCNGGSCEACSVDNDCDHIEGKGICDEGVCVECTVATDDRTSIDDTCGINVCDPTTHSCDTGLTQATKNSCNPCIADNECLAGHNCVPLRYTGGSEPVEMGGFCMKLVPGCTRPYTAGAINRESLSGAAATNYCGIAEAVTTCEAIADLEAFKDCDTAADCGSEYGEGRCEIVNFSAGKSCTYSCVVTNQCAEGADCGGVINKYCGG